MVDNYDHVLRVRNQLNGILEENAPSSKAKLAMELIDSLMSVPVTNKLLASTKIGFCLGKVRKITNNDYADVCIAAKKLVKRWKAELTGKTVTSTAKQKVAPDSKTNTTKEEAAPTASTTDKTSDAAASPVSSSTVQMGGLVPDMRNRAQKLIHKYLGDYGPLDVKTRLTVKIEDAMFDTTGRKGDQKYTDKLRSVMFNLKDPNNVELNESLFRGAMTPRFLVTAEGSELASSAVKKRRAAEEKDSIDAARTDWNAGLNATDMFACGKCKKRKTEYTQAQTRSADEPMTTFVHCLNCGNRWKC